jgi:nucleotidyltransferase-like protein
VPLADEVRPLLDRFMADVGGVLPLAALWAHGSLALGDFQPGRSDLDLVALTESAMTRAQEQDLRRMHEALHCQVPLAEKLHCAYVVRSELDDTTQVHPTWAHGELFTRIVSPVSRRELNQGGLCLLGPAPAAVVPPLTDQELADYIRGDMRDFWYPATARADVWLEDIWVDLGLLTFARATVTLREGRLITKREALEVLASLSAPAGVVRDIYQRRYQCAGPASERWRAERGHQARTYLRERIGQALGLPEEPPPP